MLPSCSSDNPEKDPEKECSVCRGEINDETKLDACTHTFCFGCICEWCRKGPGPTCPMCKAVISNLTHDLDQETPTVVDISEVRPTVQPALVEHANLQTEKRVITYKCRQCRRRMAIMDDRMEKQSKTRSSSKENLSETKGFVVAQLNSLLMLKDDILNGSPKDFITSKPEFRRLIYTEKLRLDFRNTVRKSPDDILSHESELRTPIIDFIMNELKSIPAGVESERTAVFKYISDVLDGKDREIAEKIFTVLTKIDSKTIRFTKKIKELVPIPKEYLEVFIRELTTFINSGMSFLEFCGATTYSLPNEIHYQNDMIRDDVVTLSDGENDDEIDNVPVSNANRSYTTVNFFPPDRWAHHYSLRNGLFTSVDDIWRRLPRVPISSQQYPFESRRSLVPNEINNGPGTQNSSETDSDSAMYARDSLRLEGPSQPIRPVPLNPSPFSLASIIDGNMWHRLVSNYTGGVTTAQKPEEVSNIANNVDDIVVLSDDDSDDNDERNQRKETNGNDQTIVLDDTTLDVQGPSTSNPRDVESQIRKNLLRKYAGLAEVRRKNEKKKRDSDKEIVKQRRDYYEYYYPNGNGLPLGLVDAISKVAESFKLEGTEGMKYMHAAVEFSEKQRLEKMKNKMWRERREDSDDMSVRLVDEIDEDDDADFGQQQQQQKPQNGTHEETKMTVETAGSSMEGTSDERNGQEKVPQNDVKDDISPRRSERKRKRNESPEEKPSKEMKS